MRLQKQLNAHIILAIGIRLPRLLGIEQPLIGLLLDDAVLERGRGDVIVENSPLVTSVLSGLCGQKQSYARHTYGYLVNSGFAM